VLPFNGIGRMPRDPLTDIGMERVRAGWHATKQKI
jgi:hypothetical protein